MTGRMRRRLRQVFAVLALGGFPLVVVLSYRPSGARTDVAREEIAETLLREAGDVRDRLRFEEFDYSESEGNAEVYRLRATEAIAFAEGADRTFRLKDVTFLTRDAGSGRTAVVTAPRAEFVPSTKAFRVFDGVSIEGEGVGIRCISFRYEPVRKVLSSEGPVTAVREGLLATSREGTVESGAGLVRFRGSVRVGGRDEAGRRIALLADEVDLARGGGLRARGAVVLKTDDLQLRADEAVREVFGPGDRLSARGEVTALLLPSEGKPPDTLVRVRGTTLTIERGGEGLPGQLQLFGEPARIDLPPEAGTGARRAVANEFEASFTGGALRRLTIPGALDVLESAVPARTGERRLPAARRLLSGSGQLAFGSGGNTIDTAVLDGGVTVSEGTSASVRAPRATLRGEDETAVFAGTSEMPARYEDAQARVTATVLTWFRRDGRIEAAGAVKSVFRGREGSDLLGGSPGAPVFSESDFLRATPAEGGIVLTGNVTAWQEENILRAEALRLDDRDRSLRAEENVRVVLRRRRVDPETKVAVLETMTASGEVLTHREADRIVRIEGASRVVSGTWVMNADVTDVVLGPEQTVEKAEARGNVVIEDRADGRRGDGAKAVWQPLSGAVSLEGRPATALDGKGNRLTGAILTFQRESGRIDVETGPGVPSQGIIRPEGT